MAGTIPGPSLARLSQYLRIVEGLSARGALAVGSEELATQAQVAPFLVRKDLAYCGRLGRRGQGYAVRLLLRSLREVLGQDRRWAYIIVGMNELGAALVHYPWPPQYVCVGLFDGPEEPNAEADYMQQGAAWIASQRQYFLPPEPDFWSTPTEVSPLAPLPRELRVQPLSKLGAFVQEYAIDLAMLSVSAPQAQASADIAAQAGIGAILNFTGVPLAAGPHLQEGGNEKRDIVIENVDFVTGLHRLSVQTLQTQNDLNHLMEEKR